MGWVEEPGVDGAPGAGGSSSSPGEAAAGAGSPAGGALFNGLPPERLSLSTAFEVAFRVLAKPTFIVPVLAASVAVNAFVEAFIGPLFPRALSYGPLGEPVIKDLDTLVVAFGASFAIGIVGSIAIALYGQIWVAAASTGQFPTIDGTFELAAKRWLGFIGASFVSTFLALAAVAVFMAPAFLLIRDNPALAVLLMLLAFVPYLWFYARISMITWLAADGLPVGASIRGSWQITRRGVLRILGWSIVVGLVVALLTFGVGALLRPVPLVAGGIAQGIQLAMGFGFGVTLYRRTQAAAAPPVPQPAAPPVP